MIRLSQNKRVTGIANGLNQRSSRLLKCLTFTQSACHSVDASIMTAPAPFPAFHEEYDAVIRRMEQKPGVRLSGLLLPDTRRQSVL